MSFTDLTRSSYQKETLVCLSPNIDISSDLELETDTGSGYVYTCDLADLYGVYDVNSFVMYERDYSNISFTKMNRSTQEYVDFQVDDLIWSMENGVFKFYSSYANYYSGGVFVINCDLFVTNGLSKQRQPSFPYELNVNLVLASSGSPHPTISFRVGYIDGNSKEWIASPELIKYGRPYRITDISSGNSIDLYLSASYETFSSLSAPQAAYTFFTTYTGPYNLSYIDTSFGSVNYEARMLDDISVSIASSDNYYGIFSTTTTPIMLDNSDARFSPLLASNVSWNDCSVFVYHKVGDDVRLAFKGFTKSLNYSENSLSIETKDFLSKLDKSASFGTNENTRHSTLFNSTLDPRFNTYVKPMCFGFSGPWDTVSYGAYPAVLGYTYAQQPINSLELANLNYSSNQITTTNRNWGTLRLPRLINDATSTTLATSVSATLSSNDTVGPFGAATLSVSDAKQFLVGDSYRITDTGTANVSYFLIVDVNYTSNLIKVVCSSNTYFGSNTGGYTLETQKIPCVYVARNNTDTIFYLMPFVGYTVTETNNSFENDVMGYNYTRDYNVTLTSSAESTAIGIAITGSGSFSVLSPETDRVYARHHGANLFLNPSDVFWYIATSAGVSVDKESFEQIESTYSNIQTSFTVPDDSGSSFPTFREILEKLSYSCFCNIYLNQNGQIACSMFAASSSTQTINLSNVVSYNWDISFDDVTQLVGFVNRQLEDSYQMNEIISQYQYYKSHSRISGSFVSYQLHKKTSQILIEHFLRGVPDDLVDDFTALYSQSLLTIEYKTSHLDQGSFPGENRIISGEMTPTGEDIEVKIVSVTRGEDQNTVVAIQIPS